MSRENVRACHFMADNPNAMATKALAAMVSLKHRMSLEVQASARLVASYLEERCNHPGVSNNRVARSMSLAYDTLHSLQS